MINNKNTQHCLEGGSTSMKINEPPDGRKCLHGNRSLSESEGDSKETLEALDMSSDNANKSTKEDSQIDKSRDKEILGPMPCKSVRDYATIVETNPQCEPKVLCAEENENDDEPLFQHTYVNIRELNDYIESSSSSSRECTFQSSDEAIQNVSESFDNVEYMTAAACRRSRLSTRSECIYDIPKCNCILAKKTRSFNELSANKVSDHDDSSDPHKNRNNEHPDSAGYMGMDASIRKNTISESKETGRKYADKLITAPAQESLNTGCKGEKGKPVSSQSLRRKSRSKQRPCLNRSLLTKALEQQKKDSFANTSGVSNKTETINDLKDTPNAGQTQEARTKTPGMRVYIPNLHPKLINFLITSSTRRRKFEEEMTRHGFTIVWPQKEEGLIYMEPSDNTEASGRISNTDDEIASVFYSRLRNYFVDDSICVSKELYDELTAILGVAPLVTNCTLYIENMTWIIIGDKRSVEDCKIQLQSLMKFLEIRLKFSGITKITTKRFLRKEEVRIILESKILDKFRNKYNALTVDLGNDFDNIECRGGIQTVESVMQELHTYLKSVQGSVYRCTPLIRRLLNNTKGKSNLKELLRSHGHVCAWRVVDDVCIVYGTSPEEVKSVIKIFNRVLVSEIIKLTDSQNELMQTMIGRAEITDVTAKYGGFLEIEISDHEMEVACTLRIQEEVSSRLRNFLVRNEVIKTTQEVDNGLFKLLQRHHYEKLNTMRERCKTLLVDMTPFEDNSKCGFVLTGRHDFCMEAIREIKKSLATLTCFEYTTGKVGFNSFIRTEKGREMMSVFETRYWCVVQLPNIYPSRQNKACVCHYGNKELVVSQEDISSVTSGLAYIPCQQTAKDTRTRDDEEISTQLVARECMKLPDNKHETKYNFFACMPDTEPLGIEALEAVKESVRLCLQETSARGMSSVAFSLHNPPNKFYPAEYANIMVETVKEFLLTQRLSKKLLRVMFCARDGLYTKSFSQALERSFGRKRLHVYSSISERVNSTCPSNTKPIDTEIAESNDTEMAKDNNVTVEVNLVKDDIVSLTTDALFIPARESAGLTLSMSDLNSSGSTMKIIREQLQTCFPSGLAPGDISTVTLDNNNYNLVYLANLGSATTKSDDSSNVLNTVVLALVERCIEDEIESLAILPHNVEIDLLTDAIFEALQHFIFENCILERINIIVDNPDIKHFEERRKQFKQNVMFHGDTEGQVAEADSVFENNASKSSLTNEDEHLSFSEGAVKVAVLMGDITKQTTDAIVNSVHGNLDLSATILSKAVANAGGPEIQTELKTKQNISIFRREGLVVTGPGKLKCKYIFHTKVRERYEGWKATIYSCLQLAETNGVTSLAFPALGTGRKGIKPHSFAKAILKRIRKFATTNPKSLRDVRIVIYNETIFHTVLQTIDAFRARKRRSTLKAKIQDMLKKESPKPVEDEVRLQVYTAVVNVDNVEKRLDELIMEAATE